MRYIAPPIPISRSRKSSRACGFLRFSLEIDCSLPVPSRERRPRVFGLADQERYLPFHSQPEAFSELRVDALRGIASQVRQLDVAKAMRAAKTAGKNVICSRSQAIGRQDASIDRQFADMALPVRLLVYVCEVKRDV